MNNSRKNAGFTLIELLLYIALVGILLSAVTSFFITIADAKIKNQGVTEVDEQGAFIIEQLTQTVRNATSITSPAAGATSSGFTVVVPTASLSPTIASLSGTTLQIKEGAGADTALSNGNVRVTSFTVSNLSRSGTAGILQISFILERINNSGRSEYDFQRTFTTSVGLRP